MPFFFSGLSGMAGGACLAGLAAAGSSSRGKSIWTFSSVRRRGLGSMGVRRTPLPSGALPPFRGGSSGSSSYWGRLRFFSIMAPRVSRRATISSTTRMAVKRIREATREKTATDPTASAPERTPPDVMARPLLQRTFKMPTPEVNSSLQATMWARDPAKRGISIAQVTRRRTGRPWWQKRIRAEPSMAGAMR